MGDNYPDKFKCSLSIFNDNTNTYNPFKVQLSCGPLYAAYHYKKYPYNEISNIAGEINNILGGEVDELKKFNPRDNIKIPIKMEQLTIIKKFLGQNVITDLTGGSRRRRRPSRKYKKSAKRVFRKKSRSTRRR